MTGDDKARFCSKCHCMVIKTDEVTDENSLVAVIDYARQCMPKARQRLAHRDDGLITVGERNRLTRVQWAGVFLFAGVSLVPLFFIPSIFISIGHMVAGFPFWPALRSIGFLVFLVFLAAGRYKTYSGGPR